MTKPRKKVLITGSAGFIGSHLSKALAPFYNIVGFDIVYSVFQNVTQKDMVAQFFEKAACGFLMKKELHKVHQPYLKLQE